MPFDKFGYFIRSNTAIHPIFPPPPKECILPFESSSGTKQKVCNLPWLPTAYSIRSTPGPGIQTIFQCGSAVPSDLFSQGFKTSGRLFLTQTAFTSHPIFQVLTHLPLPGQGFHILSRGTEAFPSLDLPLPPCVSLLEFLPSSTYCLCYIVTWILISPFILVSLPLLDDRHLRSANSKPPHCLQGPTQGFEQCQHINSQHTVVDQ